jgi:hypothetical protein
MSNNSSIVACVFVAALKYLSSLGIHLRLHTLIGEIYEVRRLDGLRRHGTDTKFNKVWLGHSKGDTDGFTDTQKFRPHGNLTSLLLICIQNKGSRLNKGKNTVSK